MDLFWRDQRSDSYKHNNQQGEPGGKFNDFGRLAAYVYSTSIKGGRGAYRFSPEAVVEKVIYRKETVLTRSNGGANFVWFHIGLEDECWSDLQANDNISTPGLLRFNRKDGSEGYSYTYNLIAETSESSNFYDIFTYEYSALDSFWRWCLDHGLWLGDDFLVEMYVNYTSTEYDCGTEYDCENGYEILYICPRDNPLSPNRMEHLVKFFMAD